MKLVRVLPILAAITTLPCLAQDSPPPPVPPAPFTGYVGRYLDSTITPEWFAPNRTLRADMMKVDRDHDRLYLKAGNGVFGSYRLSTFLSRAAEGSLATGPHGEQYLPFEMRVNPESPGSGWQVVQQDGAERLTDFDFDGRGYIYLAYTLFGWGIVDQNGHLIHQTTHTSGETGASRVLTVAVDGRHYAVISNGHSSSVVYDVSNPHAVERIRTLSFGILSHARNAAGDVIAVLVSSGAALRIHTAATLITGGSPLLDTQPGMGYTFVDVTSDGTNFYAVQRTNNASYILSTLLRVPAGYERLDSSPPSIGIPTDLTFESGYLALAGFTSNGKFMGKLYPVDGTELVENDFSSYLASAYPNVFYVQSRQILPFCTAEGTFVSLALRGLGEVFSLTPGNCPPGAPTNVSATAGDATAIVSFSPPSSDGGAAITSFVVTSTPGGITAAGTASPLTVTGLTNGLTYTFTVKAQNAGGVGPSSLPSNAATPNATLEPPVELMATAASSTQVLVKWAAAGGAVGYDVMRSSHGSAFTVITTSTDARYVDNTVAAETTYLYMVRSIGSGEIRSSESAVDPATTVMFTDDPLTAGTTAKAVHVDQIRSAVNAMRAAAVLSPATFTDTILQGTTIKAVHLTELRAALDAARTALSLSPLNYGQPSITPGAWVRASHFQELRNGVK